MDTMRTTGAALPSRRAKEQPGKQQAARTGVQTLQGLLQLCRTGALRRVLVSSTGFVVVCSIHQKIFHSWGWALGRALVSTDTRRTGAGTRSRRRRVKITIQKQCLSTPTYPLQVSTTGITDRGPLQPRNKNAIRVVLLLSSSRVGGSWAWVRPTTADDQEEHSLMFST